MWIAIEKEADEATVNVPGTHKFGLICHGEEADAKVSSEDGRCPVVSWLSRPRLAAQHERSFSPGVDIPVHPQAAKEVTSFYQPLVAP